MSQQQQPANAGALIGGIAVGLLVGGTVLTLVVLASLGLIIGRFTTSNVPEFVTSYVIALAVAVWAFVRVRKVVNFVSGLLIGLAAGLLGATALCDLVIGGLSNMH